VRRVTAKAGANVPSSALNAASFVMTDR